jgi:hypothetical protein
MIHELQKQYEDDVAVLKEAIEGFIKNNKPNYMPVNLGEAYRLRELDGAIVKLTQAEDKLACLTKNFTGNAAVSPAATLDGDKFGMPTFEDGHSN